ncbi:MAG TPA: IclR family transcriptional regulator [Ktedonobacterales bacterium]
MSTSTLGNAGLPAGQSAQAMADRAGNTIRAVDRAIALLCAFSRETPALGVTELAERLNLTKSTVHRLLQVLMAHGLVAQDPSRRHYTLGYRILALARGVPGEAELCSICQPHMRALREATQETVALYGAAGDVRVCLEEFESPQVLRMAAGLGRCFPLDRGSASYALLIDGPEGEQWHRVTSQLPPERQQQLLRTVEAARERGYAVTSGETVAGAASIATPIRGADDAVVAALSIGGPVSRFTDAAIVCYTEALLEAVARVQRDLDAAWKQTGLAPAVSSHAKGGGDRQP